jgi:hypothetical protein
MYTWKSQEKNGMAATCLVQHAVRQEFPNEKKGENQIIVTKRRAKNRGHMP